MKRFNVLVLVLLVSQHALCVEVKEGAESVPLNCSQHALCVEVKEGAESVLLPCSYNDSPLNGVVWQRGTLKVHARNSSGDDLGPQHKSYVNRTSMRSDAPEGGNLSLILTTPSVNDSGNYTCTAKFKGLDRKNASVLLIVRGRGETESTPVWVKVLISLGVIGLVSVVAIISFFCCKKRRNRGGQQEMNLEPLSTSVLKVEVESGAESVQLPFRTTQDLPEDSYLKWWLEEQSKIVHVFCTNHDVREEQHEDYRGRTQMNEDPLTTGDLSLTLKHPIDRDSNIYSCTISRDEQVLRRKQVELQVKVPKVEVDSGEESVQLPFRTTVNLSEDDKVEWTDRSGKKVHVYQNMSDQPEEQQQLYGGRTQMNEDPLTTGDLSLTLRHPIVRDSNIYSCTISRNGRVLGRKQVELQVKVPKVEVESGAESVLLPFRTTADFPKDSSLKWLIDEPFKKVHFFCTDHEDCTGRTQMSEDPLTTGDLSLTLRHPTVSDSTTYSCRVYNLHGKFLREKTVLLEVKGGILGEDETINNRRRSFTDPTPLMADQSDQ